MVVEAFENWYRGCRKRFELLGNSLRFGEQTEKERLDPRAEPDAAVKRVG